MKVRDNLTFEEVNKLLNYNPDTGIFTWKKSLNSRSFFNKEAGYTDNMTHTNYIRIGINKKRYFAHRLAWLLYYKQWPKNEIDHINHNGLDNRICNLRDVNRNGNMRNKTPKNISNHNGVNFEKDRNKWGVRFQLNDKMLRIGRFNTMEEAILARKEAEKIYWDER